MIARSRVPIFFDFSDVISNFWGHLLIRKLTPTLYDGRWALELDGVLYPTFGSSYIITKRTSIIKNDEPFISISHPLGGSEVDLDTTNKKLQWIVEIGNENQTPDLSLSDWSDYSLSNSGTGNYEWDDAGAVDEGRLKSLSRKVTRDSGSYSSAYYTASTSHDVSDYPFYLRSIGSKGTTQYRLCTDGSNFLYSSVDNNGMIGIKAQLWKSEFTTSGTSDYTSMYSQLRLWAEQSLLDEIGLFKGDPAVVEFIVPTLDTTNLVTVECYDGSSWNTIFSTGDIRYPSDISPTESNLYYHESGLSLSNITECDRFAVYRYGRPRERVEPTTYTGTSNNYFPDIQYSDGYGRRFALGVILGPDDDDHRVSRVKLRITYYYDNLDI